MFIYISLLLTHR